MGEPCRGSENTLDRILPDSSRSVCVCVYVELLISIYSRTRHFHISDTTTVYPTTEVIPQPNTYAHCHRAKVNQVLSMSEWIL